MCERGCVSGNVRAGMVFNAGFAVFCAGFRRGERGCGDQVCLNSVFGEKRSNKQEYEKNQNQIKFNC